MSGKVHYLNPFGPMEFPKKYDTVKQCSAKAVFLRHLTHKIFRCPTEFRFSGTLSQRPRHLYLFPNVLIICPLFKLYGTATGPTILCRHGT